MCNFALCRQNRIRVKVDEGGAYCYLMHYLNKLTMQRV